jgi:Bacterial regulatory proteins, tetR family
VRNAAKCWVYTARVVRCLLSECSLVLSCVSCSVHDQRVSSHLLRLTSHAVQEVDHRLALYRCGQLTVAVHSGQRADVGGNVCYYLIVVWAIDLGGVQVRRQPVAARTAADRGRDVRLRLLGSAAELIAEHGWAAVSTRSLAEHAGVTPGLVHYHFFSLQALLRDAALGTISDLLSSIETIFENALTFDAGVDLLLGSLDAYTGTDPTSLLLTETYLAATRDETLRNELSSWSPSSGNNWPNGSPNMGQPHPMTPRRFWLRPSTA